MDLKEMIFALCGTCGVSGSEEPALELAARLLEPFAEVTTDANGNLYAELENKSAKKTILLDAHIDRIGFIVTDINKDGFVKLDKCGGIDIRVLNDARVTTQDGKITGTICCLPPHLSDGSEDKATPISKVWADFGMTADEIKKYIKIGDSLSFVSKPRMLLNNRVTAPSLDNRCSVAALIKTAELLKDVQTAYRVVILLSSQEETFGTGAVTGAFKLNADEAIAVDVSFASQPDISGQYGKIELSGGPMIGISPILNKKMTNKLITLCEADGRKYQLEPISGRTGTNADHIAISRGGVKTAMVSIPQRYMHTAVEVISLDDVEACAKLLADYIISGGAFDD